MSVFVTILGAIIGASLIDERWIFGMVSGALIAYLLVSLIKLRSEVGRLSKLQADSTSSRTASGSESTIVEEDDREEIIAAYRTEMEEATVESSGPEVPGSGSVAQATTTTAKETDSAPADREAPQDRGSSDIVDRGITLIREFIFGGNTAVRIGIIILFFGVGFLLKYAAEHSQLPIELRLVATAVGAMAMLVFGWRQRSRRPGYGLILQGGAVGILYLTVFAALRLYTLLPPAIAFSLLVAIVVFSAMLAVLQNSMALAAVGAAGGFLAPILASTGSGDHVALFSYFAVLNLGIIAIGWFKSWRLLNLIGFVFTFVLAGAWGAKAYTPQHFATTEPFLLLFFFMYLAVGVLFATRQKPDLKGYVDGTLVFGTPLITFGLQVKMVEPYEYGLAFTALGAGAIYVALAGIMFRRAPETMRAFTEALLAIGVVFLSLAIPLALDGRWTAAAWALEGAAILWMGIRQQRLLPRLFGALLQVGAAIFFLAEVGRPFGDIPVLNGFYLGTFIITVAALFSSWYLYKSKDTLRAVEKKMSSLFLIWGALWWFGGGGSEVARHISLDIEFAAIFSFVSLSCALFFLLSRRLSWHPAAMVSALLLPVLVLATIVSPGSMNHPFAFGGWWAWIIALVVAYVLMNRASATYEQSSRITTFLGYSQTITYWIIILLATFEFAYWVQRWVGHVGVWADMIFVFVPALMLLVIVSSVLATRWPVAAYPKYFYGLAAIPVAAYLLFWVVVATIMFNGDATPLPYLPLLNPLDLATTLALLVTVKWYLESNKKQPVAWTVDQKRFALGLLVGVTFFWLNGVLIRTLHHWAAVPYTTTAIFDSVLVQAALSIFWGLLGLSAMWAGTHMKYRLVWMAGAGLLVITVVKLFVVDLSNTGTIARIVSFIAVGILLLVVGYLTPVPPKAKLKDKTV